MNVFAKTIKMKKKKKNKDIELVNKKGFFNYNIIDKYEAGVVLVGSEIKSIRDMKVSFSDSYCLFLSETELYVRNLHIDLYESTSYNGHEPKRDRKLLLTKKELRKLYKTVKIKGHTIIPLKIYIKNGFAKLQIGLASSKKQYDKKQNIKDKDLKKDLNRSLKNEYR
jgi:SsrA-binding protein